jgi:hypothetical integral membrane protein (TIGR02206 family)
VSILSPEYFVPLGLLVVAAVVLCVAARRAPGRWIGPVAAIIAFTIVVAELSWQPYVLANHSWSVAASLPVQLCDVGGFVAAAALLWRQLVLVEVAYFWGLGGTLQAVLTPDLKDHFPSFPYVEFYVTHDLVILAALFLVVGLGLLPPLSFDARLCCRGRPDRSRYRRQLHVLAGARSRQSARGDGPVPLVHSDGCRPDARRAGDSGRPVPSL